MSKIQLFGFILSPYSQRVRFALEALNIQFDYIEVDLLEGKQKEKEFQALNALGKVPVIQKDNQNINESIVILEFLENEYGNIFPQSNYRKAYQRIWGSYFDRKIADKLWGIWGLVKKQDEDSILKYAQELSEEIRCFTKYSGLLQRINENPQGYFEGSSQLTYVDFIIAPLVLFLEHSFSLLLKKPFYTIINMDQEIEGFRQYSQNLMNNESFNNITRNLKNIPKENCSILNKLSCDNETFDYDKVLEQFMILVTSRK